MSVFSKYFKVFHQDILSLKEQKVLILLYQPLIGTGALGLYYTFYFLSQNYFSSNYIHQFLFDLLNTNENNFNKNKEKLEAVGLLETFKNKEKEKIYVLKNPLNDLVFFRDPIFSQFLFSEVGENIYYHLQLLFDSKKIKDLKNYHNISKKFEDVYVFQKNNIQNQIIHYNDNSIKNNSSQILEKYFNYEIFINHLSERFKKPFLLEWHNIEYIMKLGFVYEITPKEMALLYQEHFGNHSENNFDLNNLKVILRRKNLKQKNNIQIINTKEIDSEENEMIHYLKNSHPQRIIKNFSKNNYFCTGLCDITLMLMEKTNTEIGVINALLMYVCKLKANIEGPVPSYNYFKKILDSWTRKGIISTETAYDFLMEEQKTYNKNLPYCKDQGKLDNLYQRLKRQVFEDYE